MILPNIETFIGCESSFEEASIVLYGAPFDSTTSFRPGARFGPAAMRHESFGLETYSPYQDRDLMDISVFDSGDLELCFGSSEMALSDIQKRAEEILKSDKFPLLLGGEHLEETVRELKEKNVPIYFTIDLDCLDPAVFPGTGTPEAGGVTFLELLEAIRTVAQANVVGADVNELAPMLDASGVSTATACKVLRELLLAIAK